MRHGWAREFLVTLRVFQDLPEDLELPMGQVSLLLRMTREMWATGGSLGVHGSGAGLWSSWAGTPARPGACEQGSLCTCCSELRASGAAAGPPWAR